MTEWAEVRATLRMEEALEALGFAENHRRNHEIWCSCQLPSHGGADSKPSFSVNEDTYLWNCLTCGVGGSFFYLPQVMLGLSYEEAVEWLVQFSEASTDVDISFMKQIDAWLGKPHRPDMRSRSSSLPFFSERVLAPYRGLGEEFWATRSIVPEAIAAFKLGFDEERHRGEYVGPAALIPHYVGGKLVGYQERWIDYGSEGFPKWVPKYTNSTDFPKAETLFNYDRVLASRSPVVVVESIMTVIRLWQIEIPAVATFGASISDRQVRLLSSLANGICVSYDNDAAGKQATRRVIGALSDLIPVDVVPPPDGAKADLGDLEDDEIRLQLTRNEPGFLWSPAA